MLIREIEAPRFKCGELGIAGYRREGRLWLCEVDHMEREQRPVWDVDRAPDVLSVYIEFESEDRAQRFEQEAVRGEAVVFMPVKKEENASGIQRIEVSGFSEAVVFGYDCDYTQEELIQWGKDMEARWRVALESSVLSAKELRERVRAAIKKLGFEKHVFVDEFCVAESKGSPQGRGHCTVIFQLSDCGFCFSDMHFKECAKALRESEYYRRKVAEGFYTTPGTPLS